MVEKYLKVFLTDGEVPIVVIYSITEGTRGNTLNMYYYIKYLLTELPGLIDKNENIEQSMLETLIHSQKC